MEMMLLWRCLCLLALNAAEKLFIVKKETHLIVFEWSPPAGYFEGFNILGVATSSAARGCRDTVYGKNYICLHLTDGL